MSRFNAPSPGFAFQQRECTTSRREFLWKNFYSARIKFSPQMLSRFCFPAGFSPGSWRTVFFLAGSRRVQISRRDSCRDTRREFFPGRIPPGKRAISAGSRRDPGERRESWRDRGEIPVPILQGNLKRSNKCDRKTMCFGSVRWFVCFSDNLCKANDGIKKCNTIFITFIIPIGS